MHRASKTCVQKFITRGYQQLLYLKLVSDGVAYSVTTLPPSFPSVMSRLNLQS